MRASTIALLSILLLGGTVSADYEGLVLNELMAVNNSTIADELGEFDDWIEITNQGSTALDLQGLTLTDDLENPATYTFPAFTLEPGSYLILWADDEPGQGDFHAAFKLTSGGEAVYLLDDADILDSTDFPALGDDASWGRWPDGVGEWKILGTASPGEPNRDPEPPTMAVYLNEMMADNYSCLEDPQEPGEYPDWFELYNAESQAVDLGGMFLTDDPAEPHMYEIPEGVTIPAEGFLLFIADDEPGQGDLHTNFKLSSSGDEVYLFSDGFLIDQTSFGTLGRNTSWGRMPDGTGDWSRLGEATPGEPNRDPGLPEVALYINELMADNLGTIEDPDEPEQYPDWIELYNAESEPLDLGGMYLSDEAAQPTKYPIPAGVSIPAHGYLLFWADDDDDQGPHHTNFKLAQSDETLQLYHADGATLIDSIHFTDQQTDVSYGRYPDGTDNWSFQSNPTPGSGNQPDGTRGMTLFMDDRSLVPGDRCHLYFTLWPGATTYSTDVYIVLDAYGQYFTWPDWPPIEEGIGFETFTVYPGNQVDETVLDFDWPAGVGAGDGLTFFGAAMETGTYDLLDDLQMVGFSHD